MFLTYFLVLVCLNGIVSSDDGPLILTKYIENGDLAGGRNAAKVKLFVNQVESYSGYFTVDEKYDSNIFFWFFPCKDERAPVVIWLQGGPGASSMFGLFFENGPLQIKNSEVQESPYSWSEVSNLIYIDNPVGTGFSFTNDTRGYVTDESQVGNGLYSALHQFYQLFPNLKKNDLYVTGESYGGKYVPALAYTIHKNNPSADFKINLKGIAMGDGLTDPVNMLDYGEYLYQVGLIDNQVRNMFQTAEKYIKNLIDQKKFAEANDGSNVLVGDGKGTLFANATGIFSHYNYYDLSDNGSDVLNDFLNRDWVRQRLHVGNQSFQDESAVVNSYLSADVMKSIVPWLKVIANNYRVIVYNGQFDIIVAYPLTVNFLRKFEWCGYDEYMKTPRKFWFVQDQLAGYTRTVKPSNCSGSLTEILVRNAGHMVPRDQPAWAFDIITKLVRNEDFN